MEIKDYVYLEVKGNRAMLKPVSSEEEFEDLIVRELEHEGYSKDQIDTRGQFFCVDLRLP